MSNGGSGRGVTGVTPWPSPTNNTLKSPWDSIFSFSFFSIRLFSFFFFYIQISAMPQVSRLYTLFSCYASTQQEEIRPLSLHERNGCRCLHGVRGVILLGAAPLHPSPVSTYPVAAVLEYRGKKKKYKGNLTADISASMWYISIDV